MAQAKVLIVDDDPAGLLALEAMLSSLGSRLIMARSGRDALRKLLDHDCAVILLDVQMPGMDGFETATAIRQRERSRHTPIVFLTAEHRAESQVFRGYAVGAVDYLLKPVDPEILRSKVAVFVDLADTAATVKRQAAELVEREQEALKLLNQLTLKNRELESANLDLEAFSHTVAHDLRAPLRSMAGFSEVLIEEHAEAINADGRQCLERVRDGAQHMGKLLDGLLALSRAARGEFRREPFDVSECVRSILVNMHNADPERRAELVIEPDLVVHADSRMVRIVLENLLGNAWKFTSKRPITRIEVGVRQAENGDEFFVRDNGAGFDMAYADKLFTAFQRLHSAYEFSGSGIGLATVSRIVARHGGHIRAEGEVDKGATVYFTLEPQGA